MSSLVHEYINLFRGRSDAFGTGKGMWIKEPPTVADFERHLAGEGPGIGIAPLRDDGTVMFAAIDLDEPDFDAAREMQEFIPGVSWLESSRSGNAHVWVFFETPCQAWVARGILKEAIIAAGKAGVEVFPKQDKLLEGMFGNYINLPFHGSERPILRSSLDLPDTPSPTLQEFVYEAIRLLNKPRDWEKRCQWLQIVAPEKREQTAEFGTQKQLHICAEHIIANRESNPVVEGHRSVVYFSLAKMLLNYEAMDEDEAWHMMSVVNAASPDETDERELRRIFENAKRGFTSTGCDDPLMSPYVHPDCPIARR